MTSIEKLEDHLDWIDEFIAKRFCAKYPCEDCPLTANVNDSVTCKFEELADILHCAEETEHERSEEDIKAEKDDLEYLDFIDSKFDNDN